VEPEEPQPETGVYGDPDLDVPVPLEPADPDPAAIRKPKAEEEFPLQPLERDEDYDKRWAPEPEGDEPPKPYDLSEEPPAKAPEYRPVEDYDLDEMGPQVPAERRTGEGIVTKTDAPRPRPRRKPKYRPPAPIGPRWVWWQGVYTFPFYATSVGAWLWLSAGFAVFGVCCGLVVANFPRG
jgi:hypothetical protein